MGKKHSCFEKAPIKKSIEDLLIWEEYHDGVWKLKKKRLYIKVTSELYPPIVEIPVKGYSKRKYAVKDALRCAKVYKRLTAAGMYPPKTEFIIYEGKKDVLSLLAVMPRIDTLNARGEVSKKISKVEQKIGLSDVYWGDILWPFN